MGCGAEQKIRQLGIAVGSVRSPWLVVSVLRHGSLSNSLPLYFWWHKDPSFIFVKNSGPNFKKRFC